jgi:hypothetical protein
MLDIFGNNKPIFTSHFIERYAERIFHVNSKFVKSWIKSNYSTFYKDLFFRLNNSELFEYKNTKYDYIRKKYGIDVRLLKTGKFMFVVRDFSNIVTFIKEEEL